MKGKGYEVNTDPLANGPVTTISPEDSYLCMSPQDKVQKMKKWRRGRRRKKDMLWRLVAHLLHFGGFQKKVQLA